MGSTGTSADSDVGDRTSIWIDHLGGEVRFVGSADRRTRFIAAEAGGSPVVFLHGTGGHAEAFTRNVVPLAHSGHNCYAIDMIGHGYSAKPPACEYAVDDYVDHLAWFIESVIGGPCHIVGESLGGWVAMRYALSSPASVLSVVNVVGGGLRPVPPTEEEINGWRRLQELSHAPLRSPEANLDHWRQRMEWLVYLPESMTEEMIAVRARIYEQVSMQEAAKKIYAQLSRMLLNDMRYVVGPDELKAFPVPMLYLWTEHNPTTPERVARAAHELTPDSSLTVYERSGHWPQFEEPGAFNRDVADFVDSVDH